VRKRLRRRPRGGRQGNASSSTRSGRGSGDRGGWRSGGSGQCSRRIHCRCGRYTRPAAHSARSLALSPAPSCKLPYSALGAGVGAARSRPLTRSFDSLHIRCLSQSARLAGGPIQGRSHAGVPVGGRLVERQEWMWAAAGWMRQVETSRNEQTTNSHGREEGNTMREDGEQGLIPMQHYIVGAADRLGWSGWMAAAAAAAASVR